MTADTKERPMTSRDFCYWLQGFFEIGGIEALTAKQTEIVQRHLALVFKHEIDPATNAQHADGGKALDAIHHGPSFPAMPPMIRC